MIPLSRPIRPDDFEIISQMPGIAAVARDQDLRLFWCTPSFYRVSGKVECAENMIGTTLEDVLPVTAARERALIHQQVMDTNEAQSHYQFSVDSRVLCTIFPLDPEAFGHKGIFAVVKDAPVNARLGEHREIPVLMTPNLYTLNALSARELEVLYFVATGLKTDQIAERVNRATKTIEHHINSIHKKLGTHSRAQLVRFSSERGIQSFSSEEWSSIVKGAGQVRRESAKAEAEAEIKPRAEKTTDLT